ncbi:telomeric repeat binding factor a [Scomber scombrus]|uniref:telomeric repeat binding factor a n=1 Tax=Scomber scombrus TaxID=13677 RepID=UPI002DDAAE84|nr:telomeric repeat binding factor a [Scomber scombrus]
MAATETVNSVLRSDVESIVNRWLVDYYLFLATELFKNEEYSDFCEIRDVLQSVLARPLESTDSMRLKIQVLQLLSRINDGDRLDLTFDSDDSVSPLESALMLLENISEEYNIPQQDFESVSTSLKEMIVGIFIKDNRFERAKELLNKHFPKPMVGKKAIFMGLISQKSNTHEVIEQINFQRFKAEVYAFCQRLCPFTVPFLQKAARQLIDKRQMEEDNGAVGPDEQDEPGPSSTPQINTDHKHTIIQRSRLEATYKALAAGSDKRTFTQLEEEVESEEQVRTEKEISLRLSPPHRKSVILDSERDSGSPMEGSPADQPPQTDTVPPTQAGSLSKTPRSKAPITLRNRRLYTVAQLVIEPDSQGSSQCTSASQELEAEVTTEEPEQTLDISHKRHLQSPETDSEVSIATKKRSRTAINRVNRASSSLEELSADSEEETRRSVTSESVRVRKHHNQTNSSQSRDKGNTDEFSITDYSLDSSPNLFPRHPLPRTSSTPQKDPVEEPGPSGSKWKQLFNNAKESKDTWNDEDMLFTKKSESPNKSTVSNSGQRRKWTESESQKLRDGVKRFGEGAWGKIRAHYSLDSRTNVNLKDRWRTMKKSKLV